MKNFTTASRVSTKISYDKAMFQSPLLALAQNLAKWHCSELEQSFRLVRSMSKRQHEQEKTAKYRGDTSNLSSKYYFSMKNISAVEIDTVQHDNVSDKIHLQSAVNIENIGEQISPKNSRKRKIDET